MRSTLPEFTDQVEMLVESPELYVQYAPEPQLEARLPLAIRLACPMPGRAASPNAAQIPRTLRSISIQIPTKIRPQPRTPEAGMKRSNFHAPSDSQVYQWLSGWLPTEL